MNRPDFQLLNSVIIILNTILLCLDGYPENNSITLALDITNEILTFYFLVELIAKLIGHSIKSFLRDNFNLFDALIVIANLVAFILSYASQTYSSRKVLAAFRGARLLRIFRLVHSWKALKNLLKKMGKTIIDLKDFSILFLFFIFVFSLLGSELYAYKVRFNADGSPTKDLVNGISNRLNFDTFFNALLLIFILFTNDGWNYIMYDHIRTNNETVAVSFFIPLEIIGNFTLISLFLAILIRNFSLSSETNEHEEEVSPFELYMKNLRAKLKQVFRSFLMKKYQERLPSTLQANSTTVGEGQKNQTELGTANQIKASSNDLTGADLTDALENLKFNNRNNRPRAHSSFLLSGSKLSKPFTQDSALPQSRFQNRGRSVTRRSAFFQGRPSIKLHEEGAKRNSVSQGKSNIQEDSNEVQRRPSFISTIPSMLGETIDKYSSIHDGAICINSEDLDIEVEERMTTEEEELYMKYLEEMERIHKKEGILARFKRSRRKPQLVGKAFNLLTPNSSIRKICFSLVNSKTFDRFITILIIISSINLALGGPLLDPASMQYIIIWTLDLILNAFFTIEFILKIIAYGALINGHDSYFRSVSNYLDFVLVLSALVSYSPNVSDFFRTLKILRALRVLRPLRMIEKNEGLKIVIDSILASLPAVLNLLIVNAIFFLVFGIFGVNYLKGMLFSCNLNNVDNSLQNLIVTKTDCMDYGGDWVNADTQYDNIFMAFVTLFQVATLNGWTSLMFQAVDAVGINEQPVQDNNRLWILFYIAFVLLGGFFILNLFVGVVVDIFNRQKKDIAGLSFLTTEQADWVRLQLLSLRIQPQMRILPPTNKILKKIFILVKSKSFDHFINFVVLVNLVLFMLYWNRQNQDMETIVDTLNNIMLVFFLAEAVLKIVAYGRAYFKDNWNLFDLLIVILTSISTLLQILNILNVGKTASVLRSLRVGRLLRLIRNAKSLRVIFSTLISTLPSIINIGGLLLLIVFVYAVIGMNLFGYLRPQTNIDRDANFNTFGISFMTLLRMSTGENWNDLMTDCARHLNPSFVCFEVDDYESYERLGLMGCGSGTAWIYFISFQLIFAMMLLNLFVAVLIETFEETSKAESFLVPESNLSDFVSSWRESDMDAQAFIPINDIERLFDMIPPPLGWYKKREFTRSDKYNFLKSLNIHIYNFAGSDANYYYFDDVLLAAVRRVVAENYFTDELDPIIKVGPLKQIEILKSIRFKNAIAKKEIRMLQYTNEHHVAILIITRFYKKWKLKRELKEKGIDPEEANKLDLVPKKEGFFKKFYRRVVQIGVVFELWGRSQNNKKTLPKTMPKNTVENKNGDGQQNGSSKGSVLDRVFINNRKSHVQINANLNTFYDHNTSATNLVHESVKETNEEASGFSKFLKHNGVQHSSADNVAQNISEVHLTSEPLSIVALREENQEIETQTVKENSAAASLPQLLSKEAQDLNKKVLNDKNIEVPNTNQFSENPSYNREAIPTLTKSIQKPVNDFSLKRVFQLQDDQKIAINNNQPQHRNSILLRENKPHYHEVYNFPRGFNKDKVCEVDIPYRDELGTKNIHEDLLAKTSEQKRLLQKSISLSDTKHMNAPVKLNMISQLPISYLQEPRSYPSIEERSPDRLYTAEIMAERANLADQKTLNKIQAEFRYEFAHNPEYSTHNIGITNQREEGEIQSPIIKYRNQKERMDDLNYKKTNNHLFQSYNQYPNYFSRSRSPILKNDHFRRNLTPEPFDPRNSTMNNKTSGKINNNLYSALYTSQDKHKRTDSSNRDIPNVDVLLKNHPLLQQNRPGEDYNFSSKPNHETIKAQKYQEDNLKNKFKEMPLKIPKQDSGFQKTNSSIPAAISNYYNYNNDAT